MVCVRPMYMDKVTGKFQGRALQPGTIAIPCGKCKLCRKMRAKEWGIRLLCELEYHDKASFVTLTYSDNTLPEKGLKKEDLQKYFKRLRKDLDYDKRRIKYYACGEYGEKYKRPHYHAIIFGVSPDEEILNNNWNNGIVHTGSVTYQSCMYVSDYISKSYDGKLAEEIYGQSNRPFNLMSKGLGLSYAIANRDTIAERGLVKAKGRKHKIPRYFVRKLELDKEELVKKGLEKAKEVLDYHREKGRKTIDAQRIAMEDCAKQSELNEIARCAIKEAKL